MSVSADAESYYTVGSVRNWNLFTCQAVPGPVSTDGMAKQGMEHSSGHPKAFLGQLYYSPAKVFSSSVTKVLAPLTGKS